MRYLWCGLILNFYCVVKLTSLGVAKSILHQVTAALSVAEQELKFEHRWSTHLHTHTDKMTRSSRLFHFLFLKIILKIKEYIQIVSTQFSVMGSV